MAENCKFCEIVKRICSPNCPFPALFNAGVITPFKVRHLLNSYTPGLIQRGVGNATDDEAGRFVNALRNEVERRMNDIIHGSQGFNARLAAAIDEKEEQLADIQALIGFAEAGLHSSENLLAQLDLDILTASALLKDKEKALDALEGFVETASSNQVPPSSQHNPAPAQDNQASSQHNPAPAQDNQASSQHNPASPT